MNKLKILFLSLSSTSVLFAQCNYNLDVQFDFFSKTLTSKVDIKDTQKSIQLNTKGFHIENEEALKEALNNGENKVSFTYKKKIKNLNEKYVYLLNNWYPQVDSRCTYDIKTNLDSSFKKVYEDVEKEITNFNFIASRDFNIRIKKYNDITIKTYFLQKDENLVKRYFDKTIEYIKLYEKMIGKYPYDEFKIVENVYQTGYSMPTYTLIGSRLLNKDYILNQSLGHELLHQYFGNSVFSDFNKGNWTEGLTTYLADDYYKKLSSNAIENRKVVLNQYSNFVNKDNEIAIKDFKYRFNKSSSLIGYNKLSFVFHMLENKIGKDSFNALIKKFYKEYKFKEANLEDLASFFTKNSNKDLRQFFSQWLDKKGMIDFQIANIKSYYNLDGFNLEFELIQDEKNFYQFTLPIEIKTYDKKLNKLIEIKKSKQRIKLNFSSEVISINLDKNYDLFRKLTFNESFLAISDLMTKKNLILVVNKSDFAKYQAIKRVFPKAKIILTEDLKFNEIKENSVVFLDSSNELLKSFYPNINIDKNNSYLLVKPHIYSKNQVMAIFNFGEYKKRYLMMLRHFSQYSKVVLSKDKALKIKYKSQDGIKITLNQPPKVTEIKRKDSVKNIYKKIADKKIIYVGESHTNFEDHLNQLRVIKALHQNGKKIAIAMEMFQKPFQKDLDEYIEGKTSLDEFLKNTEYYARWKYDYSLYKPIIDYAKKNSIPLVALNIDRKINRQVSKASILSLNKEQKKLAPKEIDQSNLIYKNSLEQVFKGHSPHTIKKGNMKIDNFYQSQLIWDEIMAQNIDEYIKENEDTTVVVLAGSGHIEKHHGIPSRTFRRNSLPYQVIITNPHNAILGDLVLINKTATSLLKEKKVGVVLNSNEDLTVIKVTKDSYAEKIKIKKDDKIVKLNNKEVSTIADIKRILFQTQNINTLKVTVKRGTKSIELTSSM